jgi:uncharacterized membrane protein
MTNAAVFPFSSSRARALLHQAWAFSPLLVVAGLVNLTLIPLFLVAVLVDPRLITGAPAWHKPLKFAISITIYVATFVWLLTFVQGRQRWVRRIAAITGLALLVEIGLITMQVLRGTSSHFNATSPFNLIVYSLMGGFITAVSLCTLLLAIWLIRQRMADAAADAAFAWSLRLGVLIAFVGMAVAFLMTMPTADQLAVAQAGGGMPQVGAHGIGVAEDGPGLPFLGWRTTGGDLRAPHFVGLHAMQALPLWGGLLLGRRRRLGDGQRLGLVWTAGLGYLGLTLLLTWQALRGQSVIAPDGLTLLATAVLLGAILLAAGIILSRKERGDI